MGRTALRTTHSKLEIASTMRSLPVSSAKMTSPRSMMPSHPLPHGWTQTKMPRRRSSRPSKRSLRASVCLFYKVSEVVQEVCQVVCLTCLVDSLVDSLVALLVELLQQLMPTRDLRSRRLIKLISKNNLIHTYRFMMLRGVIREYRQFCD